MQQWRCPLCQVSVCLRVCALFSRLYVSSIAGVFFIMAAAQIACFTRFLWISVRCQARYRPAS
jgi:hypothetical protein